MLILTYIRRLTLVAAFLLAFLVNITAQTRFTSGQSALGVPFELSGDLIILNVRVNRSRPLHFIFDTGAGISVIDPQSAAALRLRANKHKMLETLGKQTQSKMGGAGGSTAAVKAHVAAIELGSFAIKNPLVVFATGTEGSEGSTEYDGSLDNGLFSQFKMILDYSRSRVILERNTLSRDLSGLEIVADPPRFRTFVVNAVEENSPAALAGIQEEDTILAIDSQPTSRLTLRELRHLFTQPGEHVLKIKRGSQTIQVRMRLQATSDPTLPLGGITRGTEDRNDHDGFSFD